MCDDLSSRSPPPPPGPFVLPANATPCDRAIPRGPCHWDRQGNPRNVHALPQLASISPLSGPVYGGTRLQLSGSHMRRGRWCSFGRAGVTPLTAITDERAECTTPRRMSSPEYVDGHWEFDPSARLSILFDEGDSCDERGTAAFRYFWYNLTDVIPDSAEAAGGARVELFAWGLRNNGARASDIRCKFGDQAVAPVAVDVKRSSVACVVPPLRWFRPTPPPARLDVEVRLSLNGGADYLGREWDAWHGNEPLLFSYVKTDAAAIQRRRQDAALEQLNAMAQPLPVRPCVLLPQMLVKLVEYEPLGEWMRDKLPQLPYFAVYGAAGADEPAGAATDELDAHARASLLTALPEQALAVCERLRADAQVSDGFTLVGLGQGALLARAVLETCAAKRPGRVVLLDGPQLGSEAVPLTPYSKQLAQKVLLEAGDIGGGATIDEIGAALLSPSTARADLQQLSLASYMRPPPQPRAVRARWWEGDPYVSRLANLRATDATQRDAVCALEALLLGASTRNSALRPARSALMEWVDERLPQRMPGDADPDEQPATVALRDSKLYRDDLLCLQALDRASKLFVVDEPQLSADVLRGDVANAAPFWQHVVLPFVDSPVPEKYITYEDVPMVQDPQTGQLVPQEPLDEQGFDLPPPSPPPPGAAGRSGASHAAQGAAMQQQQERYDVLMPAQMRPPETGGGPAEKTVWWKWQ